MNTPRKINQISILPAPRMIGHGGKNRAIPSWVWALESTPSESTHGLTPTLRRVTLTNLIAGPLWLIGYLSACIVRLVKNHRNRVDDKQIKRKCDE